MADNKIRFGLENVAIALRNDADDGYETPVKIPGAVKLSTSPEGDSEVFYADNGPYFTFVADAGYTGELEIALIPDDIKSKILGWQIDKNGAMVEMSGAVAREFALLFQVNGDKRARRNVYYSCTVTRPSEEHNTTEDKISATTETLNITMIPQVIGDNKVTKLSIEPSEANKTVYDNFYKAVLEPDFTNLSTQSANTGKAVKA